MPERKHSSPSKRKATALFALAAVLLCLAPALLFPPTSQAQPDYSYDAFHTELFINADGSLLVRNKVTYEFRDPSGWVGLFVPSSYGTLVEAWVREADGALLPDGAWEVEPVEGGYTLWVESSGSEGMTTFIYEYLLYHAFEQEGDRVGIPEWGAVPVERSSPIRESSLTLSFPAEVDPSAVELDVFPVDYSGQIATRFVGGRTAVIEASFLPATSSYSVRCYWPASVMDLTGPGFTQESEKSWGFERFDVEIDVNEDASITVRETQVVNFRGSFSYLNRFLSTQPASGFEGRTYGRVRLRDIEVFDLDGQPYDPSRWSVEAEEGGKNVRIEFEARDEQKGWIISYRVTGALIFAADYDRLYWNAVSRDREVVIKSSTTSVRLPPTAQMDAVQSTQYLDIYAPPAAITSGREGGTLWWRAQRIPAYTTYTIDVAFPKGVVSKPWQYDRACGAAVVAASSALLAAALLLMGLAWWRKGRDIGRSGTAMVRYDPPPGLTPAMVGMLVHQKPRVQDISATIVDLARRGYLTIFEQEQRSIIRMRKYGFQRKAEDLSALLPYERKIMEGLFASGNRVSESDLANQFYVHIDAILKRGVSTEVMKRGLFTAEPAAVRGRYLAAGAITAAVALACFFVLPRWLDLGWFSLLLLAFVPTGVIIAAFGWAMPRRSREGSLAYEHVMGFREYMQTAEKQELEYMTPENFQANLPYAMVLGVADAWARKFEDIYTTPPSWYQGTGGAFSTVYLTSSLADMTGRLNSTLTSSPSSSASGGGGGFGGGSSGGGFGGGGSSAG